MKHFITTLIFLLSLNVLTLHAEPNYEAIGKQLLEELSDDKSLNNDQKTAIYMLNYEKTSNMLNNGLIPEKYNYLSIKKLYFNLEDKKNTCTKGDAKACFDTGIIYTDNISNYEKSVSYFDIACNKNIFKSCTVLNHLYIIVPKLRDYKKAKEFATKACDGGDATGCNNLGYMYHNNLGIDADYDKALGLYKRACKGNDSMGCDNFKDLYSKVCLTDPKKYCSKYE